MSAGPIVFDIETGKLPEPHLTNALARTFKPPKMGRTKDEEKIKAKVEEALTKAREGAALSAATGRILAIGYFSPEKKVQRIDCISEGGSKEKEVYESDLLSAFWKLVETGRTMLGWNIKRFDLPFLIRRSLANGVQVPNGVIHNRYFAPIFVDVLWDLWSVGDNEYCSLDNAATMCNIVGKYDEFDGSEFETYFLGGPEPRRMALEYLERDVVIPWEIACRLGYR